MELADKAVGFLLSYISLSIFTYYTFWVIILPFVNTDHFIHRYFLPQEYAILIPVFAGMVLLCLLSIFIGVRLDVLPLLKFAPASIGVWQFRLVSNLLKSR